ncbi:MAG: hypothetical protein ACT4P6_17915 [Gemmatimonadaceae bacterium]
MAEVQRKRRRRNRIDPFMAAMERGGDPAFHRSTIPTGKRRSEPVASLGADWSLPRGDP